MAKYTIEKSTLDEIGDAVRSKDGGTELIPVRDLKQRILDIPTGLDTSDATAEEKHVVNGETFYADGEKKTGNMPCYTPDDNEVAWSITSMAPTDTEAKTAVEIPEGHYEGGSYPTTPLPVRFPSDITPGASDITVQGGAWFTNNFNVKGDTNLVSENIKKDVTIFGVTGSHEGGTPVSTCELDLFGIDDCLDRAFITDIPVSEMTVIETTFTKRNITGYPGYTSVYVADVICGTSVVLFLNSSYVPGAMEFSGVTLHQYFEGLSGTVIVLSVDPGGALAMAYL